MSNVQLILGGARSGKSGYAEQLAKDSALQVVYLATAHAFDDEMQARIIQHQQDRPSHWSSIEAHLNLAQVIREHSHEQTFILVDCLTLWLMNVLQQDTILLSEAVDELLAALNSVSGSVVLVSNEISMGVVPMGELTRQYVDELGRLHQRIAKLATGVTLMVAGLPMTVK